MTTLVSITAGPTGHYNMIVLGGDGIGNEFGIGIVGTDKIEPFCLNDSFNYITFAPGSALSAGIWYGGVWSCLHATSRTLYQSAVGGNVSINTDTTTCTRAGGLPFTRQWNIGGYGSGDIMDGAIAQAAAWSCALTEGEARQYLNGLAPNFIRPSNLVIYVPFYDSGAVIVDQSPNKLGNAIKFAGTAPVFAPDPPIFQSVRPPILDIDNFINMAPKIGAGPPKQLMGQIWM